MESMESLGVFLKIYLSNKRSRYLGFIAKPKSQKKFLDTIYHELEGSLNSSMKVKELPSAVLEDGGFLFSPPNTFGEPVSALKEGLRNNDESFLLISRDGKHGIHGPETFIDSRAYYGR